MHRTMLAYAVMAIAALAFSGCKTEVITPLVAARITVDPQAADLSEGDAVQLTATVFDDGDQTLTRAAVEWSADDRSVVRVDDDGRARALAPGSTLVWATFEGVAGSALITVLTPAECAVVARKPKSKPEEKRDEKGNKGKRGDDDGDDEDDDDDDEGDDDDDDDGDDDDDDDDDDDEEDEEDEEEDDADDDAEEDEETGQDGDGSSDGNPNDGNQEEGNAGGGEGGDDQGPDDEDDQSPEDDEDDDDLDEDEDGARCTPPSGA